MKKLQIVSIKLSEKGNTTVLLAADSLVSFCGIQTTVYGAPQSESTACWFCLKGNHTQVLEAKQANGVSFHVNPAFISVADETTGHRGGFINPNNVTEVPS